MKYRRSDDQGSGFDAITTPKLRHMTRGAHIWVDESKWHGEFVLSAVEVGGPDFVIMGFIENAF